MHRDLWGDVQHGQHQDQDIYDSYHAQLYMRNEPKTTSSKPGEGVRSNRLANHHKPSQRKQGSVQQSRESSPKGKGTRDENRAATSSRYTYGMDSRKLPTSRTSPTPNERAKSAGIRTPGRSATMVVRGTQPKQSESSISRTKALNHSQTVRKERSRIDEKMTTPYGPARQVLPSKSRHGMGVVHSPRSKGGTTPFGSAQRLQDPTAGVAVGAMRTPRDEGASLKPRMPLTQHRTGLGRSSGKVRRSSGYSNFQG